MFLMTQTIEQYCIDEKDNNTEQCIKLLQDQNKILLSRCNFFEQALRNENSKRNYLKGKIDTINNDPLFKARHITFMISIFAVAWAVIIKLKN